MDVGCGTGALSEALADYGARRIVGVDLSPSYVAHASARLKGKHPDASFQTGDATVLKFPDDSFDASVSGLLLNFVPKPETAAREMVRVTRPRGLVGAYVWDYAGRMDIIRLFWDAALEVDPARSVELDEGKRFSICSPERLKELFATAGLAEVAVTQIDQQAVFPNFQDFWSPFLGGQGPAPGYAMSLSEDLREQLRRVLKSKLPLQENGTIPLLARAWAVRGTKPMPVE